MQVLKYQQIFFIILLLGLISYGGDYLTFLDYILYKPYEENYFDFYGYNYFLGENNWLFYRLLFI